MRPRIVLFDAALDAAVPSLVDQIPAQWQWSTVALSQDEYPNAGKSRIVAGTKSQSCQCSHAFCVRDAVVAWLPERAIVAAVIVRPALRCLAWCCDVVFAPKELAAWCHSQGIPVRTAATVEHVLRLFASLVKVGAIASRHQAQLYRNYLAEVE